jgi:MFS superfamily sulfate permease-like transporter
MNLADAILVALCLAFVALVYGSARLSARSHDRRPPMRGQGS